MFDHVWRIVNRTQSLILSSMNVSIAITECHSEPQPRQPQHLITMSCPAEYVRLCYVLLSLDMPLGASGPIPSKTVPFSHAVSHQRESGHRDKHIPSHSDTFTIAIYFPREIFRILMFVLDERLEAYLSRKFLGGNL